MIKSSLSFILHDYKDGIQKFRYRTEVIDTKFSQDALSYYVTRHRSCDSCAIVRLSQMGDAMPPRFGTKHNTL